MGTSEANRASSMGVKTFLVAALAAFVGRRQFRERLWPFGMAVHWVEKDRPLYSEIDTENDSLQIKHGRSKKLYERREKDEEPLLKGPETVVFGNDGTLYALTEEGFLVSLTDIQPDGDDGVRMTAKSTLVADLGVGRPLGGRFAKDGNLYLADAHLGLTRIKNPEKPHSKVELIASRVFDEGNWSQLLYVNDVAIGPKTGAVYFTASTEIAPDRIGTRTWDTMYMAKVDLIRGKPTGRLLKYDPSTDEVTVLARDLFFANGIAVDKDETYIFFAETFTLSLLKYNLQSQSLEKVVDGGLTGYPDGADCAWKGATSKNEYCYSVMPSAITPLLKLAYRLPDPVDRVLRTLVLALPKSMVPPIKPYGSVVEVDPVNGGVVRYIQDPSGTDISRLAGVTVHDNKLYLGSLTNDYIAIYELD